MLLFAFAVPIACLLLSLVPGAGIIGALLAVLSMALGLAVERWLFFAEAEHVVDALLRRRRGVRVRRASARPSPHVKSRAEGERAAPKPSLVLRPAISGWIISASISALSARRGPGRLK